MRSLSDLTCRFAQHFSLSHDVWYCIITEHVVRRSSCFLHLCGIAFCWLSAGNTCGGLVCCQTHTDSTACRVSKFDEDECPEFNIKPSTITLFWEIIAMFCHHRAVRSPGPVLIVSSLQKAQSKIEPHPPVKDLVSCQKSQPYVVVPSVPPQYSS